MRLGEISDTILSISAWWRFTSGVAGWAAKAEVVAAAIRPARSVLEMRGMRVLLIVALQSSEQYLLMRYGNFGVNTCKKTAGPGGPHVGSRPAGSWPGRLWSAARGTATLPATVGAGKQARAGGELYMVALASA